MAIPLTHFLLLRLAKFLGAACCGLAMTWLACAGSHASELSDALSSPRHVLLMRHALAPGVGDPADFTLADCNSQRNLDGVGQQQALAIGRWLKKQGVTFAQVYTSPWCRCKDTAALLKFGGFKIEASLASFFDDMGQAQARNAQLQRFIAERIATKGQQALILVTHHVNIREYMGENIGSGDMVLVQVNAQGGLVSHKIIRRPA